MKNREPSIPWFNASPSLVVMAMVSGPLFSHPETRLEKPHNRSVSFQGVAYDAYELRRFGALHDLSVRVAIGRSCSRAL